VDLRAARANRVFRADEKRIRTENTVIVKNKDGMRFLYKITDWARMCFSSVPNRRSARTGRRPRKLNRCGRLLVRATSQLRSSKGRHSSIHV
jgi:hypothetical protein